MEIARELLARGAAVDAAAKYDATPLIIASHCGRLGVVRLLLARGAAVDAALSGEAADCATALSVATATGHAAIAQLLRAAAGAAAGAS